MNFQKDKQPKQINKYKRSFKRLIANFPFLIETEEWGATWGALSYLPNPLVLM